ncbi:EamA family transporter RarD [Vibrio algarum]|uniref:EamA family transporter RarD n=1 Tax=Vibrio algarum TaxID=3020714 RepID=A0ABT4YMG8_9VIBR|nr:EamA family transporter RarD [Vibrio sp. KJ40-1]MDB1122635.1 EamA family transporter RarD [Vibrio sp. KJ40-1]
MTTEQQVRSKQGVLLALAAYTMWGIAPIYFKAIIEVAPLEILSHRIIWSFVFLAFLLHLGKRWKVVAKVLKQKKSMLFLTVTSLLVATNWLIFIWAVNTEHMIDASLGYYINPLFNVLLGMVFLGERLRKLQWFAVLLAFLGVAIQIVAFGKVPVVALALATSFGCYGLLRKKINLDAQTGLFIETMIILPAALIYLALIADSSTSNLVNNELNLNLLLFAAGIVTTLPLLCFNGAATRIMLSTLGFFQYIGPSLMFLLAVFIYHEPFSADKALTFTFIWAALIIFSFDGLKFANQNRKMRKAL